MASKLQEYRRMSEEAQRQLTGSLERWQSFLATASRLYKYPYHEQVMIHAQRPDATACAEFDVWNNTMRRYVRRGSKGIALIDTSGDRERLRYVFDVSDTGTRPNSRSLNLWELREEHIPAVSSMLEKNYGVPTGFLVIRNPSRYLERPEALYIFAYVLHRALAQQNVMEREKIIEAMNPMEPTYDVYISFFRDLEIRTAGGTLTEQIINAPKTIQLVAYLLLKPERAHSPREIFEHLNPGEDFDGNTNAIRGSIYRFSNMYAKRTGQSARLIIREGSGYRRNPNLKITTDIEQFDLHLKAAEAVSGSAERIEELRKAVELYKGPVFMCGRDQLWLNDIVSQYEVRYIKAADALMRELAKQKDYAGVMQYAARAHELFPGNGLICYWLIMATYSLSGADMAKKEYFRLKDDMTQEEINVVTEHLKKNSLIRYEELFGV